jgi:argininosuccinate lyase
MQKAMPTSVKTWAECYIYSNEDNIRLLEHTKQLIDQSPLGTAAGYGVPVFEIDRQMTAQLMGFSKVLENPIYAQLSRGKFESAIIHTLSQIMFDANKIATDLITFSMDEFGFINLPVEFCTGSSIMPQKKNPDVLELIRAKYHIIIAEEIKVKSMISNLIFGYNRDLQLVKEPLITSFEITFSSISILSLVLKEIVFDQAKCQGAMSAELYATQEAYEMVKNGVPFRDAYRKVGEKFGAGGKG